MPKTFLRPLVRVAVLATTTQLPLAALAAPAFAAPPARAGKVNAAGPAISPVPVGSLPPSVLTGPQLPKALAPTPAPAPALGTAPRTVAQLVAAAAAAEAESGDGEDLTARVKDLEVQLEQTRELVVGRRPSVTLGGYADFGFFAAQGDGSGIIRDNGNLLFPSYAGQYGWVFLGDLLAPTMNSRGEVADLGDAAGAPRFDSVHSHGNPSFIINEVNLTLNAGLGDHALSTASINFMPRSGHDFALGDFMEVDIAQVEWTPTSSGKTSIFVGKFDSVVGIEYRDRKATQRFGITPSLLARYTTGTNLGLKIRSKFGPADFFTVAAALTNGSFTTEQFHFYDEVDSNAGKTASGRVSVRYPGDAFELELGVSGSYGAQDRARDSSGAMWFAGVDLLGHMGNLDVKAQWLKGEAPGNPMDAAYGLKLHQGAYLELDWMFSRFLGVIGRGEFRDALVWLGNPGAVEGANRAYLTKSWRATVGAKAILHQKIALKAEYLRNGEYGGIPGIANDVFTSSLLFSF
jgi:hypothetical protein